MTDPHAAATIAWHKLLTPAAQKPLGNELLPALMRFPADSISFAVGAPDPAYFPAREIASITERVMLDRPSVALQYGPVEGYLPLREVVADIMEHRGGRRPDPGNILITAGSSQALAMVAELLLAPGDTVIVTRPTFANMLWVARARGARVVEVGQDDQGLDTDDLERLLRQLAGEKVQPKFLYALPNFHNPAGVSMSMPRRQRTIELAHEFGMAILEDDAYHELSYDGDALPTLYSMDPRVVISTGTFSKLLAPGVRLGWLVAPPSIMSTFVAFKHDTGTNPLVSHVVAEYCRQNLAPRIPELRRLYGEKRDALVNALSDLLPADVHWARPGGGFFVWLELPDRIDGRELFERAKEQRLAYITGDMFMADNDGPQFARFAFSFLAPPEIKEGVRRFRAALDQAAS